jgi:hypothetical protein
MDRPWTIATIVGAWEAPAAWPRPAPRARSSFRRPDRCVITRTRDRSFTLRMISRPMRSRSSQSLGSGFFITSSAPSARASNARPVPEPWTEDETTRIGVGL